MAQIFCVVHRRFKVRQPADDWKSGLWHWNVRSTFNRQNFGTL